MPGPGYYIVKDNSKDRGFTISIEERFKTAKSDNIVLKHKHFK